jgi:outer membrane protein OmpA-like peptidoglycan-associated protein/Tol biopolymer transport system component
MKKNLTILFTYYLLLTTCNSFAQQIPEKAMASYFKAKDFGSRTQWEEGIEELKNAIKIYPKYTEAKALLGEYYFALKQYDDVISILESNVNEKDFPGRSFFMLSETFLRKNNAEKAKLYAEKYLAQPVKNPTAANKAEQTVRNAIFAIEAKKHPVPFNPKNLGPNINTKNWEYFPYMTPDGKWLAFTRLQNNQEDLYIAYKTDTSYSIATSFGEIINSGENEGAETMNADGTFLFFTSCNKMDGYGSCDIYYSRKINNQWSRPGGIGKPVNSPAWEAQPSFSSDSKALYFTSNRKGGFGGKDVWVCYLDENMKFGEPQNLGPNINTAYDDQCPFIHADNQTLYFTSNGWPGMGGGDIFVSRKTDTGWTKAENVGYPINTENDDNAMTVSYDGKTAFLVSNREGGFGGLDIYSFDLPENLRPQKITFIKAIVKDVNTKQLLNANYSIIDLDTKKEIYKGVTIDGSFFVSIELNKNYALQIQKEKYLFYSQNINLKESASKQKPYELEILLEPLTANSKITLNNVFFDFDKSDLQATSFVELDKVAELLQKNPTIKIEIAGHTDNKGDKKYNQILSQKRAETVVNYLVQKGIAKTRLVAKGYGDTVPLVANDTEENKAKNRRTELKVL